MKEFIDKQRARGQQADNAVAQDNGLAGASLNRNDAQAALASTGLEAVFARVGKVVEAFGHMLGVFKGAPKGAHYVLCS